jgi:hypothetical protein
MGEVPGAAMLGRRQGRCRRKTRRAKSFSRKKERRARERREREREKGERAGKDREMGGARERRERETRGKVTAVAKAINGIPSVTTTSYLGMRFHGCQGRGKKLPKNKHQK